MCQLMDERANSKLTFAYAAKEVLCKTKFILMKIKSFSCETLCTSTRFEKEGNSNSEVKVCI